MNPEVALLFAATFSVAFFHTLSPDHWLPFVMVGQTQRWSLLKTELVALVAGIGHVGTSVVISLVGLFIAAELSHGFAAVAEIVTGAALMLFGFSYAFYMWRQGGHHHFVIGGDRFVPGHEHHHDHTHGSAHEHHHDNATHETAHEHHDDDPALEAAHEHPHANPGSGEHTHSKSRAGYGLVVIMGLTPCVALLPLAFAAASYSTTIALWVMAAFAVFSIVPILILTFLGSLGLSLVRLEWFEKYGDILTGVVIGCIGVAVTFLGL